MGKPWENHGENLGKPWETVGRPWFNGVQLCLT